MQINKPLVAYKISNEDREEIKKAESFSRALTDEGKILDAAKIPLQQDEENNRPKIQTSKNRLIGI